MKFKLKTAHNPGGYGLFLVWKFAERRFFRAILPCLVVAKEHSFLLLIYVAKVKKLQFRKRRDMPLLQTKQAIIKAKIPAQGMVLSTKPYERSIINSIRMQMRHVNGKWQIKVSVFDKYDFTKITTFMGGGGNILGKPANDAAAISQEMGAITPFNIRVKFTMER